MKTSENDILSALKADPDRGFRMLMDKYKEPVYWHIRRLVTAHTDAQKSEKQRMSREQLAEVQARHIARQLAFDDKTTAKFVDTYTRCQKEIWTLAPKRKSVKGAARPTPRQKKPWKSDSNAARNCST